MADDVIDGRAGDCEGDGAAEASAGLRLALMYYFTLCHVDQRLSSVD